MSGSTVEALTWVAVVFVVALYGLFVLWRVRVDRRKKAAKAALLADLPPPTRPNQFVGRPLAQPGSVGPATGDTAEPAAAAPDAPAAAAAAPAADPLPPPPPPTIGRRATVADVVQGITLPYDLAPLTTLVERPGVGDRVAFWTDRAPAEVVGAAVADEFERLGFAIEPVGSDTMRVTRDGQALMARLHASPGLADVGGVPAFPSVPPNSVVLELWVD
jgi:hypothetical protein